MRQHRPVAFAEALDALTSGYAAITAVVAGIDEKAFRASSRCDGWTIRDVLFHQLLDAQRALITFASPSDADPDVDYVEYWRPFKPGMAGAAEHAAFVRRPASAYSEAASLAEQWTDTAAAAARAASLLSPSLRVTTQGHVLRIEDFMATLAVEAAIHHLDMTLHTPQARGSDAAQRLAVATLDGLLGELASVPWDATTHILKGTGRLPLDAEDRAGLGDLASQFPLLG